MKAKVKSTGVIIDVELCLEAYYHDTATRGIDEKFYYESKLDFNINTPQKQSVTIEGWVARDRPGVLLLSGYMPIRGDVYWKSDNIINLPIDSFPDLKWEDEPKLVTIQITEK